MKRTSIAILFIFVAGFVASPALAKTTFISVGTGGTGGIYYPYGGGVAEIWSKYVKGVKAVAEVTGASVENVKLAHKGETVIGEVMGDVAVAGFNGLSKFKGKKHDILSMAIMYPNLLQVVALKSTGITDINQVKGRSISTGSPGSGTNFMAEAVLKAWTLHRTATRTAACPSPKTPMPCVTAPSMWASGRWDPAPAPSWTWPPPTRSACSLLRRNRRSRILAANKTYSSVELAGGVYRGIDKPVSTIGVWNVMICQASLDTEMVYKLAKALFEHNDYLQKIHPSAAYTTPENAVKYSPIPLHPGTIKYLEEKGIAVPDKLRP
jgi:TRAP-type uncharacterized transport system substrate-binding protein